MWRKRTAEKLMLFALQHRASGINVALFNLSRGLYGLNVGDKETRNRVCFQTRPSVFPTRILETSLHILTLTRIPPNFNKVLSFCFIFLKHL
ncbi:hypothetical protein BDZ45DRAFT_357084 [Acephala macrosclerotiorum]|nr:hypothetical protein BDZ45DRAFT_357084 [Acephala macrosclerotiorum]